MGGGGTKTKYPAGFEEFAKQFYTTQLPEFLRTGFWPGTEGVWRGLYEQGMAQAREQLRNLLTVPGITPQSGVYQKALAQVAAGMPTALAGARMGGYQQALNMAIQALSGAPVMGTSRKLGPWDIISKVATPLALVTGGKGGGG